MTNAKRRALFDRQIRHTCTCSRA